MTTSEMYAALCEMGLEQAADCATSINGFNEQTCLDVLYWATGYKDFESYFDESQE